MRFLVLLFVTFVGALPGVLRAETVNVGGVTLEIPAPAGYTSINGQPQLFDAWKRYTDSTATLAAGFMSLDDFKAWMESKDFEYGFYNAFVEVDTMLASMPANRMLINGIAEQSTSLLPQQFRPAFVTGSGGRYVVNPALEPDEPALVTVDVKQGYYTMMIFYNTPGEDYPMAATAQVLVGGRIIDLVLEGYYESEADIGALQRQLDAWVAAVLAANR